MDYTFDVTKVPEEQLTFKDLLSCAYQVARGMEYLASKRVRSLKREEIACTEEEFERLAESLVAVNLFWKRLNKCKWQQEEACQKTKIQFGNSLIYRSVDFFNN